MKNDKQKTRLELHREELNESYGLGRLLIMSDLCKKEKALISNDFFELAVISGPDCDLYDVYAKVLARWGIMCPHPEEKIKLAGGRYNCDCCGSLLSAPPIAMAWKSYFASSAK